MELKVDYSSINDYIYESSGKALHYKIFIHGEGLAVVTEDQRGLIIPFCDGISSASILKLMTSEEYDFLRYFYHILNKRLGIKPDLGYRSSKND